MKKGKSTDKKENQIFLMYKEMKKGSFAKSFMIKYLYISSYIRNPFLIYDFSTDPILISEVMKRGKR
jgi:hypothetical protein